MSHSHWRISALGASYRQDDSVVPLIALLDPQTDTPAEVVPRVWEKDRGDRDYRQLRIIPQFFYNLAATHRREIDIILAIFLLLHSQSFARVRSFIKIPYIQSHNPLPPSSAN